MAKSRLFRSASSMVSSRVNDRTPSSFTSSGLVGNRRGFTGVVRKSGAVTGNGVAVGIAVGIAVGAGKGTIGALSTGDTGVVVGFGSSWAIGVSSGDDSRELPGPA